MKNTPFTRLAVLALFAVSTLPAHAGTTTGLPWESPLTTIKNSLSGPVAMTISIIAVCVCGAMLIWGGEMGEFAKRLVMVVLVISLLVASNSIISTLFSATGALL